MPIVSCVIGEGGSGGALAIAVADTVMMLQYSTYSVISPEGCASILFKDAGQAPRAAEALALTAPRLSQLGLVDRVLSEPLGGAHRDPKLMATTLKKALVDELRVLMKHDMPRCSHAAPRGSRATAASSASLRRFPSPRLPPPRLKLNPTPRPIPAIARAPRRPLKRKRPNKRTSPSRPSQKGTFLHGGRAFFGFLPVRVARRSTMTALFFTAL